MIFGKIFFKILIIRWDIWEVWNENLGEALTHLLGRWRECGSGGSCGNGGRAPVPPKGDKPEKDGGSCGRCEIAPEPPKGDKLEKDGGDYGSGGSDGRG